MKTTKHKSIYFYGNKISEYGLKNHRLDYGTLAKAFEAVRVNDITKLFYTTINNEYIEPELINGIIDNEEQIEELKEQKEELTDKLDFFIEEGIEEKIEELQQELYDIEEKIEELEQEQENSYNPEIYQYYIINEWAADVISEFTNDPIYYIDYLDMYIWGVTHWGTSWDYVLTDVKIELEESEE